MFTFVSDIMKSHKNIVIFASGKGSNAAKIINYFTDNQHVNVNHVFTNKAGAGVIDVAKENGINYTIIEKDAFFTSDKYIIEIKKLAPSLIILAGFLWKVPENLVKAFPNQIINIHPALLPKFGGKGMYGHFVHEAVIAAKEPESGITIHFVNEHYDEGKVILQAKCNINETDTPVSLAAKIQELEHKHLPEAIESLLK